MAKLITILLILSLHAGAQPKISVSITQDEWKRAVDSTVRAAISYQLRLTEARLKREIADSMKVLAVIVVGEVPRGNADGVNKRFDLLARPLPGTEAVYVDERRKLRGRDYSISPTGILTFAVPPSSGAAVVVDYMK